MFFQPGPLPQDGVDRGAAVADALGVVAAARELETEPGAARRRDGLVRLEPGRARHGAHDLGDVRATVAHPHPRAGALS